MKKDTVNFKFKAIQYNYTKSNEITWNPSEPTKDGISDAQVTCKSCTNTSTWSEMKAMQGIGSFILTCQCGASEIISSGLLM